MLRRLKPLRFVFNRRNCYTRRDSAQDTAKRTLVTGKTSGLFFRRCSRGSEQGEADASSDKGVRDHLSSYTANRAMLRDTNANVAGDEDAGAPSVDVSITDLFYELTSSTADYQVALDAFHELHQKGVALSEEAVFFVARRVKDSYTPPRSSIVAQSARRVAAAPSRTLTRARFRDVMLSFLLQATTALPSLQPLRTLLTQLNEGCQQQQQQQQQRAYCESALDLVLQEPFLVLQCAFCFHLTYSDGRQELAFDAQPIQIVLRLMTNCTARELTTSYVDAMVDFQQQLQNLQRQHPTTEAADGAPLGTVRPLLQRLCGDFPPFMGAVRSNLHGWNQYWRRVEAAAHGAPSGGASGPVHRREQRTTPGRASDWQRAEWDQDEASVVRLTRALVADATSGAPTAASREGESRQWDTESLPLHELLPKLTHATEIILFFCLSVLEKDTGSRRESDRQMEGLYQLLYVASRLTSFDVLKGWLRRLRRFFPTVHQTEAAADHCSESTAFIHSSFLVGLSPLWELLLRRCLARAASVQDAWLTFAELWPQQQLPALSSFQSVGGALSEDDHGGTVDEVALLGPRSWRGCQLLRLPSTLKSILSCPSSAADERFVHTLLFSETIACGEEGAAISSGTPESTMRLLRCAIGGPLPRLLPNGYPSSVPTEDPTAAPPNVYINCTAEHDSEFGLYCASMRSVMAYFKKSEDGMMQRSVYHVVGHFIASNGHLLLRCDPSDPSGSSFTLDETMVRLFGNFYYKDVCGVFPSLEEQTCILAQMLLRMDELRCTALCHALLFQASEATPSASTGVTKTLDRLTLRVPESDCTHLRTLLHTLTLRHDILLGRKEGKLRRVVAGTAARKQVVAPGSDTATTVGAPLTTAHLSLLRAHDGTPAVRPDAAERVEALWQHLLSAPRPRLGAMATIFRCLWPLMDWPRGSGASQPIWESFLHCVGRLGAQQTQGERHCPAEEWLQFLRKVPAGCARDSDLVVWLYWTMQAEHAQRTCVTGQIDTLPPQTALDRRSPAAPSEVASPPPRRAVLDLHGTRSHSHPQLACEAAINVAAHFSFLPVQSIAPPFLLNWLVSSTHQSFRDAVSLLVRGAASGASTAPPQSSPFLYLALPMDELYSTAQLWRVLAALGQIGERDTSVLSTHAASTPQDVAELYARVRAFVLHTWYVRSLHSIFSFLAAHPDFVTLSNRDARATGGSAVDTGSTASLLLPYLAPFILRECMLRSHPKKEEEEEDEDSRRGISQSKEQRRDIHRMLLEEVPFVLRQLSAAWSTKARARLGEDNTAAHTLPDVTDGSVAAEVQTMPLHAIEAFFRSSMAASRKHLHEGLVLDFVTLLDLKRAAASEAGRDDDVLPSLELDIVRTFLHLLLCFGAAPLHHGRRADTEDHRVILEASMWEGDEAPQECPPLLPTGELAALLARLQRLCEAETKRESPHREFE